jgi:hypothetical protein
MLKKDDLKNLGIATAGGLITNGVYALLQLIFSRLGPAAMVLIAGVVALGTLWVIRRDKASRGKAETLWLGGIVAVVAFVGGTLMHRAPAPGPCRIEITLIPPAGIGGESTHEDIAGLVEGITDPSAHAVVLFVHTLPPKWYPQPEYGNALTEIGRDLRWKRWTHSGTRYAAILVRKPYLPPDHPLDELPALSGDVLAITDVAGR